MAGGAATILVNEFKRTAAPAVRSVGPRGLGVERRAPAARASSISRLAGSTRTLRCPTGSRCCTDSWRCASARCVASTAPALDWSDVRRSSRWRSASERSAGCGAVRTTTGRVSAAGSGRTRACAPRPRTLRSLGATGANRRIEPVLNASRSRRMAARRTGCALTNTSLVTAVTAPCTCRLR